MTYLNIYFRILNYLSDDTSLLLVIFYKELSVKNLNDDLNRINNWAFQWEMSFNPDPNKQAQEILFSRKI